MDLEDEDWVDVPYDGLLDDGDEKIFSRKYVKSPTNVYKPGYFNIPKTSQDYVEDEPIFEKQSDHDEEVKEIIKHPILIQEFKETSCPDLNANTDPDLDLGRKFNSNQDPIFHVFFKEENQFVEMITGSQESDLPCIETAPFQHDEKHGDHVVNSSSPSKMIKKEVVAWKRGNQGLNFWKRGLSGIGVVCCVGMTAATICIIICGNGRRHKLQNQKLRFQIYPENKRVKQVMQKANEAMSAARGVPLVKAQITYGGRYESL
ncbi:hypothetical protein SSX86_000864 [Deinandra increscens subsp. villosa]|uniref:DUF6821 domain-containing protein n=1 Tax=Deinandra increscens subsp. villosa TaxID=3103831 RepID=A0AAP0DXZ5_9ASTR